MCQLAGMWLVFIVSFGLYFARMVMEESLKEGKISKNKIIFFAVILVIMGIVGSIIIPLGFIDCFK